MSGSKHRGIEIVGSGLAGLTLAVGLRQMDVPVTIREAGTLPRHRVCGEFICGNGTAILERMGLGELLHDGVSHRQVDWFVRDKNYFSQTLPLAATGISRYLLDQRLADFFCELGGRLILGDRVNCNQSNQAQPGTVWCNGRKRASGKARWLGMKLHLVGDHSLPGLQVFLGEGCYVGLSAIENGQRNLCGLFRVRPELTGSKTERMITYLRACGLCTLAETVAQCASDNASFCAVSGLDFSPPLAAPATIALGDQYGMIAPFTGNGMSIAIESAALAIAPLVDFVNGHKTWEQSAAKIQQLCAERFRQRMFTARWLHPLMLNSSSQFILGHLGRQRFLPLCPLFKLTH